MSHPIEPVTTREARLVAALAHIREVVGGQHVVVTGHVPNLKGGLLSVIDAALFDQPSEALPEIESGEDEDLAPIPEKERD